MYQMSPEKVLTRGECIIVVQKSIVFKRSFYVKMKTRNSYELMVLDDSILPEYTLKKVTKLIMSILLVVILVTCIVIGLLIKHTSHKDEVYEHFTMRTESRNYSIDETVFDSTTVISTMSLNEASTDTSLITTPALTTKMMKGRLNS